MGARSGRASRRRTSPLGLLVRNVARGTGNIDQVRVDYTNWDGSLAVVEREGAEPVGSEAS